MKRNFTMKKKNKSSKIVTFFTGLNYLLTVSAVSTEQSTEQTQGVDGCVFLAYYRPFCSLLKPKKKPKKSSKTVFFSSKPRVLNCAPDFYRNVS